MDKNKLPFEINGLTVSNAAEIIVNNGFRFRVIEWENADGVKTSLDNPTRRAMFDKNMVNLRVKVGKISSYTIG